MAFDDTNQLRTHRFTGGAFVELPALVVLEPANTGVEVGMALSACPNGSRLVAGYYAHLWRVHDIAVDSEGVALDDGVTIESSDDTDSMALRCGDFDGDGVSDLLLQAEPTTEGGLYLLSGSSTEPVPIPTDAGTLW